MNTFAALGEDKLEDKPDEIFSPSEITYPWIIQQATLDKMYDEWRRLHVFDTMVGTDSLNIEPNILVANINVVVDYIKYGVITKASVPPTLLKKKCGDGL